MAEDRSEGRVSDVERRGREGFSGGTCGKTDDVFERSSRFRLRFAPLRAFGDNLKLLLKTGLTRAPVGVRRVRIYTGIGVTDPDFRRPK